MISQLYSNSIFSSSFPAVQSVAIPWWYRSSQSFFFECITFICISDPGSPKCYPFPEIQRCVLCMCATWFEGNIFSRENKALLTSFSKESGRVFSCSWLYYWHQEMDRVSWSLSFTQWKGTGSHVKMMPLLLVLQKMSGMMCLQLTSNDISGAFSSWLEFICFPPICFIDV